MEDGALAAGGRDGVRMRREQDRRKRLVPGDEGIEIPGIAADGGSGPVLLQPDAERGIAPQQMIAHAALTQRRIVDRNQLPERPKSRSSRIIQTTPSFPMISLGLPNIIAMSGGKVKRNPRLPLRGAG
ncbi:MAG: hypothetical protein ACLUFI_04840 [Oscillospiraceae bacterium]